MSSSYSETVSTHQDFSTKPIEELLRELKTKLKLVFHDRANIDQLALERGWPSFVLREIMSINPLSIAIPKEYGGRGGIVKENLGLLSTASYESLSLSLMFGINYALFLQPIGKYGQEALKAKVFKRFLEEKTMGGLMITEPEYGSDALNMHTSFTKKDNQYHIKGTKHWAGLTGWAEYWLLTARQQEKSGELGRDIDFFVTDANEPDQQIMVEELYDNIGLYAIPYGRNRIDVKVPLINKLQPHTSGIKMMLDLLHRSRMQFPGMGMGFIHRMLDEAITHCQKRFVGGKSLLNYDQVQHRLSKLQASFTICSAMCVNSSESAKLDADMSPHGLEANAIKSIVTDLMQEAAQSVVQLVGAEAYKIKHIAGRGMVDSRPFQIFEGSNDILYAQITEGLIKLMKRAKENNLFQFLKSYSLTNQAIDYVKELMNFNLDMNMPQRKLVKMGKILGYTISLNYVLALAKKGFCKDLIENAITILQQDISSHMTSFSTKNKINVVEDYQGSSDWMSFANA